MNADAWEFGCPQERLWAWFEDDRTRATFAPLLVAQGRRALSRRHQEVECASNKTDQAQIRHAQDGPMRRHIMLVPNGIAYRCTRTDDHARCYLCPLTGRCARWLPHGTNGMHASKLMLLRHHLLVRT